MRKRDDDEYLPQALIYQRLMARPVRFGDSFIDKMRRFDEQQKAQRQLAESQQWTRRAEQWARKREASLRKQENFYLGLFFLCVCLALYVRACG
jgi:cell shape-determining protein MreC